MGFLDRLYDVATGIGGAVQAPVGLGYDLLRAPFVDDDDYDGLLHTLWARTAVRGGQVLGNLFGPEEGLGAAIGGLPEPGLRTAGRLAFEGLETVGREGIREPIATLMTVGSLSESDTWEQQGGTKGLAGLIDPDTWSKAHEIAQTRSVGQTIALAWGTKDILDPDEVNQYVGTDAYNLASGTIDALGRLFFDADTLIAGGAVDFARAARSTRPGTVRAVTAPQLGGRASRFVTGAKGLDQINTTLRNAYAKLPPGLQRALGTEDVFGPEDIPRLMNDASARIHTTHGWTKDILGAAGDAFARDINTYLSAPARAGLLKGRLFKTRTWGDVEDWMGRLDLEIGQVTDATRIKSGLIRDRLFPKHHYGDVVGHFLASAGSRGEREALMRIFMGDMSAINRLAVDNYATARRLEDLTTERGLIFEAIGPNSLLGSKRANAAGQLSLAEALDDTRNYDGRLARIGEEMDAVVAERIRLKRISDAAKSLPSGPVVTASGALRTAVKRSWVYQKTAYGHGIRVFTDMAPHHLLDLNDSAADAQFSRMLGEAGFDDTAIAGWRGRFNETPIDGRHHTFGEAIQAAETRIMGEYGVTKADIETVMNQAQRGRQGARSLIGKSRFDAQDRALIRGFDGELFEYPLRVSELANVVPVTNFRMLRKNLERYARLQYGTDWRAQLARGTKPAYAALGLGHQAMVDVISVWKPAVLLRPAWTVRVVGDEQMRRLAKFGVLATLLSERGSLNAIGLRIKTQPHLASWLKLDDATKATRRGAITGALAGGALLGPIGALGGSAATAGLLRRLAQVEEAGVKNLSVNRYKVASAFGSPGDNANLFKDQVSAGQSLREFLNPLESGLVGRFRADPYQWRSVRWGESATDDILYRKQWTDLMARVFASDPMTRKLLAGDTPTETLEWLLNTAEGRTHAARLPGRKGLEAEWVDNLSAQIDDYTANLPDVKAAVLSGDQKRIAKALDLIPDDAKAVIHGPEISELVGRGPIREAITDFVDTGFEVLGTMATDELSRNPTFGMFYQAEMRRLLGNLPPGRITENQLHTFEDSARRYALGETRDLLYDLAERSEFAQMTRILMPFFPAFQEVLTRWAGLVVENPRVGMTARKIFNAPNRAGMVYQDEEGNEYITFRIPKWAGPLISASPLFSGAVDSQGYVRMAKDGFNLVAQGTPGFGPFAQIAVSEIARARPELEESLRFVIPFGPVTGIETFLPPAAKRALSLNRQEDDASYASALARVTTTKLVQMESGELPKIDFTDPAARSQFIADTKEEVDALFKLRLVAAYVAPVAPIFDSPYRAYIDVYRALRSGDVTRAQTLVEQLDPEAVPALQGLATEYGRDADAIFYDLFGEEFFALTQSFTRSNDGVPPTVEGLEARDEFRVLIERYPEWGSVITGEDGGGTATKFSRAAYDRQLKTPLRVGAEERQRARLAPEEILSGPQIREGWMLYSRYMDRIVGAQTERGLPNLNVKEAEDLRLYKHAVIMALAQKYPRWFEEFSTSDRLTWDRKIEGAQAIASDPRLAGRQDIAGVRDYLALRDLVMGVLETREAKTLTAASNQDLAFAWDTLVSRLVEQNPAFGDLWTRKLENDPLRQPVLEGIGA